MLRTLTFLACLTAASHASAKNNLSTADYWEWRNVSSPQVSHDGKAHDREVCLDPDHRNPSVLAPGQAGADQAGLHSHFCRACHRRRATADFVGRLRIRCSGLDV